MPTQVRLIGELQVLDPELRDLAVAFVPLRVRLFGSGTTHLNTTPSVDLPDSYFV